MSNITTISYKDIRGTYNPLRKEYIDTVPNFIKQHGYKFNLPSVLCTEKFMSKKQMLMFSLFCIKQLRHPDPRIANALNCIDDHINDRLSDSDLKVAWEQTILAYHDSDNFQEEEWIAYKKAKSSYAPHAEEYRLNYVRSQTLYEKTKTIGEYIASYLKFTFGVDTRICVDVNYQNGKLQFDRYINYKQKFSFILSGPFKFRENDIWDLARNYYKSGGNDYLLDLFKRGANFD